MEINILQGIDGASRARGLAVIIDVYRAFTLECYAFAGGCEAIIPVGDITRTEIFTIGGARISTMAKGVNIIRRTYANGAITTHKVIIK